MEAVSVRENSIVDLEMLQDFDAGQWGARKDRLLLGIVIELADILIHIENIFVAQSFNILFDGDCLLNILVSVGCCGEDGVVDNDPMNVVVLICFNDSTFKLLLIDSAKIKPETARILISTRS